MKKILIGTVVTTLLLTGTALALSPKEYPEFSDVAKESIHANDIYMMQRYEVIKGYSDGTFGPQDSVTREQFATMLARYDKIIIKQLRSDNQALKNLVCAQFKEEDYETEAYQNSWNQTCFQEQGFEY